MLVTVNSTDVSKQTELVKICYLTVFFLSRDVPRLFANVYSNAS